MHDEQGGLLFSLAWIAEYDFSSGEELTIKEQLYWVYFPNTPPQVNGTKGDHKYPTLICYWTGVNV